MQLVHRIQEQLSQSTLVNATSLFIAGSLLCIGAGPAGSRLQIGSSLLCIGIVFGLNSGGTGFLSTPATTMGIGDFTGPDRVDGSSILNTLRQIASSFAATLAVLRQNVFASLQGSDAAGTDATHGIYGLVSAAMLVISLAAVHRGRLAPQPGPGP